MANSPEDVRRTSGGDWFHLVGFVITFAMAALGLALNIYAQSSAPRWLVTAAEVVLACACLYTSAYVVRYVRARLGRFLRARRIRNMERYNNDVWHRREAIRAEAERSGHSRSLEKIDPNAFFQDTVPYFSFMYSASKLEHLRHVSKERCDGAMSGLVAVGKRDCVAEGAQKEEDWAVYGPYLRLPRLGRYAVVFSMMCRRESRARETQDVVIDVLSHPGPPLVSQVVCVDSSRFQAFVLEFCYDCEKTVEFRVHPHGKGNGDVVLDTVSVLAIGYTESQQMLQDKILISVAGRHGMSTVGQLIGACRDADAEKGTGIYKAIEAMLGDDLIEKENEHPLYDGQKILLTARGRARLGQMR